MSESRPRLLCDSCTPGPVPSFAVWRFVGRTRTGQPWRAVVCEGCWAEAEALARELGGPVSVTPLTH